MKKFVAILTLPIVLSIVFLAAKLYVADHLFAAYSLVLVWLTGLVLWIRAVGPVFAKKPGKIVPAVPRAYITRAKVA